MSKAPNPDGYVHARTPEEYERLRAQSRMWEEATRGALELAGLKSGMSCLDIGAGPGEAMRLMGYLVGPTGRVTGLDIDGTIAEQALASFRAQHRTQFRFIEGNVLGMDTIEGAPFDLCFTRFTLMHLDDPVAALTRMRAWTKPQGHVVALDYDFAAVGVEPEAAWLPEFDAVFQGVFKANGRDLRSGRHLPARFAKAGLKVSSTRAHVKFGELKEFAPMLQGVYSGLLPAALRLGLTTEAKAEAFRQALARAAEADAYIVSPMVMTAVAQVS